MARDRYGGTGFSRQACRPFTPVLDCSVWTDAGAATLDVELLTLSISFPHLPKSFDGYRILHLSDTHLDCLRELATVATGLLAGNEVDLLALTGDIHGHHRAPLSGSIGPLAELIKAVRVNDRRVAVLGNHDPTDMAEALEAVGFDVLANEPAVLSRGDDYIVLTGLDDVHRFYTPNALEALSRSPGGFRIALVHSAELADYAAAAGYALYLCGQGNTDLEWRTFGSI